METSTYIVLFITAAAGEESRQIAEILLERKKAACINIIPEIHSRFWWEGKLDAGRESLLIVKTKAALLTEIIELVKEVHSNRVPEIIALPIIGGNQEYLDWIDKEVA